MSLTRILIACGLLIAAGCSDEGPELAEVTGKVTLDGQPLRGVNLVFKPQGGSPSYGTTDANGEYRLYFTRNKTGAMPGSHTVEISSLKLSKEEIAEMKASGQEVPDTVDLPRKYSTAGTLTAEVQRGRNTIDFELTSD
jgi:hypothetical protein